MWKEEVCIPFYLTLLSCSEKAVSFVGVFKINFLQIVLVWKATLCVTSFSCECTAKSVFALVHLSYISAFLTVSFINYDNTYDSSGKL